MAVYLANIRSRHVACVVENAKSQNGSMACPIAPLSVPFDTMAMVRLNAPSRWRARASRLQRVASSKETKKPQSVRRQTSKEGKDRSPGCRPRSSGTHDRKGLLCYVNHSPRPFLLVPAKSLFAVSLAPTEVAHTIQRYGRYRCFHRGLHTTREQSLVSPLISISVLNNGHR